MLRWIEKRRQHHGKKCTARDAHPSCRSVRAYPNGRSLDANNGRPWILTVGTKRAPNCLVVANLKWLVADPKWFVPSFVHLNGWLCIPMVDFFHRPNRRFCSSSQRSVLSIPTVYFCSSQRSVLNTNQTIVEWRPHRYRVFCIPTVAFVHRPNGRFFHPNGRFLFIVLRPVTTGCASH